MKVGVWLLAVLAVSISGTGFVQAGEIDLLVGKLVEKGVLSQGEAQQLITETKEGVRKQNAQGTNESLPSWAQKIKLGGDLRVRYQGENHTTNSSYDHRDRARLRLRYGFDVKPNDQMHVGVRLATGEDKSSTTAAATGPEQTSTNQTFTNTFNNKWIWVDQAYLDYTPFSKTDMPFLKDMQITGGKFPNPFYTTDMVWDPDINPEGGYIKFSPAFGVTKPFLILGFLPIGESKTDSNDPFIFAAQGGLASTVMQRPYKIGVSYFNYDNIKGMTENSYSRSYDPTFHNALDGTLLKYDFNIVEVCGEFSPIDFDILGKTMPFTLLGDYADNIAKGGAAGDIPHHTAWLAGAKLGKAADKGTWELFYNYREIGQNAVYAMVNDSDFHLGGVAAKGHKFGLAYAIMPNSTLSATYFIASPYKVEPAVAASDKNRINIIQLDWVTKF
jgi:hypothetical protein